MSFSEIGSMMYDVEMAMRKAPVANDGVQRLTVIWGGVRYDVCTVWGVFSAGVYRWERDGVEVRASRRRVNTLNKIREANEALANLLRKDSPDMTEVVALAESIAASAKRHATL